MAPERPGCGGTALLPPPGVLERGRCAAEGGNLVVRSGSAALDDRSVDSAL